MLRQQIVDGAFLSQYQIVIEGDIFVSINPIKDNAKKLKVTFENELHRVMIHGVLHLIGYDDKTPELKQAMRQAEDDCLQKLA